MSAERSELLHRLIALFLVESPKLLQRMSRAVKVSDYAELEYGSHTLKSSSLQLGAERLAGVCVQIETESKALTEKVQCAQSLELAYAEFELVKTAMNEILRSAD